MLNEKMISFPRLTNSNRALNTTIAILYTTIQHFRYISSHPLYFYTLFSFILRRESRLKFTFQGEGNCVPLGGIIGKTTASFLSKNIRGISFVFLFCF